MTLSDVFVPLPDGLRKQLLEEYRDVVSNYKQGRWAETCASGGRFCEAVYSILKGYPPDTYPSTGSKPSNFPQACWDLQKKDASVDSSIRLLIPRALPGIYDIRNNRDICHLGDVSAHHMDASYVLPTCSWIMAELVRVFVNGARTTGQKTFKPEEAQAVVDELTTQPVLVVWERGKTRRILDTTLNLYDQILLLAAGNTATIDELREATEHYTDDYITTVLNALHAQRLVEFNRKRKDVTLTSAGISRASRLAAEWQHKAGS